MIVLSSLVGYRDGVQDVMSGINEVWEIIMLNIVYDCFPFLTDKIVVAIVHQTAQNGLGNIEGSLYVLFLGQF